MAVGVRALGGASADTPADAWARVPARLRVAVGVIVPEPAEQAARVPVAVDVTQGRHQAPATSAAAAATVV